MGRTLTTVIAITLSFLAFLPDAQSRSPMRPVHRTLEGEARKKEILRKVEMLADMSYGVRVHKVKPGRGEKMIFNLAIKQGMEEDTFKANLTAEQLAFGDMIGWGTFDVEVAKALFASNDDSDPVKEARRAGFGQKVIRELSEMSKVSFGFTDGSSSYCGMSFMGLLVVDEEKGIIYEISLTGSGPC